MTLGDFQQRLQGCEDLLILAQLLFDAFRAGAGNPTNDTMPSFEDMAKADAGIRFFHEAVKLLRGTAPALEPAAPTLSPEQWTGLKKLTLDEVARQGRMDVVARELLLAVDGTIRNNLWKLFEAKEGRVRMRPGDVFPIASHNLKDLFQQKGISITSRPGSKNLGLGKLSYLGVMPPQHLQPYEVEFNFDADAALSDFVQDPVVGVALPHLDFEKEFTFDPRGEDRFFNVRPIAEQAEHLLALVDEAERRGATLVLQPELSVTPGSVAILETWFRASRRTLATYVSGSFHGVDGTRNVNRAPLFTAALPQPLNHDKFNPYEIKKLKGAKLDTPLQEDIAEGPVRITVHWSRGWSFTTLICKDMLDERAQSLLSTLRLNFVFLVALSAETESFRRAAETLLNTGQTMTFMANFVGDPQQQTAAAALAVLAIEGERPYEHPNQLVRCPSILIFKLRQRKPGWQAS